MDKLLIALASLTILYSTGALLVWTLLHVTRIKKELEEMEDTDNE